jgi:hypothetical protein
MKHEIDLEKLTLSEFGIKVVFEKTKLPKHKPGELFLKGPIPINWLQKAGQQSGKALHVAIALWFWAGIKKSSEIKFSVARQLNYGVKRNAVYRGLNALEKAGLISIERHIGRSPIVTIKSFKN